MRGRIDIRFGIGSLRLTGRGAPIPLRPWHTCWFLAMPFWHGRQRSIWLSRTIARCLSISASTILCPGNSAPCALSSWALAGGLLIKYCLSSIVAHEHPSLAILAIFMARCMSDYSSCTRPPCLAIVADMSKTYKELVAAFKLEIRQLPLPYMLLQPPPQRLKSDLAIPADVSH